MSQALPEYKPRALIEIFLTETLRFSTEDIYMNEIDGGLFVPAVSEPLPSESAWWTDDLGNPITDDLGVPIDLVDEEEDI